MTQTDLDNLNAKLPATMLRDRPILRRRLNGIDRSLHANRPTDHAFTQLSADIDRSQRRYEARQKNLPKPTYPEHLPVVERREEIKAAIDGYIAYFGDYVVDEDEKSVTHQTKGSLFPNLVGKDQKRFYSFSGNQLTLTTPPTFIGGVTVIGVLLWERYS